MKAEFEQNEVSRVVWPWMEASGVDEKGGAGPSAIKVLGQAALMVSIALILLFVLKHHVAPTILLVTALYIVITGFFFPKGYALFERFIGMLVKGVGIGLTWLMLVPFFYLFFTPGRIMLALRGKDTLSRKCPTDEPTYWVDRPTDVNPDHYTKQFR